MTFTGRVFSATPPRYMLLVFLLFLTALGTAGSQARTSVGASGLPVPRFVSLGSDTVYVRTGPGKQYPIDWVYVRKGLPLKVMAEYDIWRKVSDQDGSTGWIHGSLLSGRQTAVIQKGIQTIYEKPDVSSWPVVRAEPGVIADLLKCERQWCSIRIDGKKGWINRAGLWGAEN